MNEYDREEMEFLIARGYEPEDTTKIIDLTAASNQANVQLEGTEIQRHAEQTDLIGRYAVSSHTFFIRVQR